MKITKQTLKLTYLTNVIAEIILGEVNVIAIKSNNSLSVII